VAAQDYVDLTKSAFHGKGISYLYGGYSAIPATYQRILEAKGSMMVTNQAVASILIDDAKTAVGVKLAGNDKEVYAKIIISNVDWHLFAHSLLPDNTLPAELMQRIDALEHNMSGIIVHVALNQKLIKKKFIVRAPQSSSDEIFARYRAGEKP
jgi:phytoene dehydrogenase-like protein